MHWRLSSGFQTVDVTSPVNMQYVSLIRFKGLWRWLTNKILLCLDIIHRLVFTKKSTTFRRLESVSVFRWHLLRWAQSIELVPIYGHQQQSESRCDLRSVGQSVLVSSPIWGSLPEVKYCLTVRVFLKSGAPSDEGSGLSFVTVIVIVHLQYISNNPRKGI
jgi:hypothetical protein